MATIAGVRPSMSVTLPRPAVWVLLAGTLISATLGALGGAWDLSYHGTYTVDTFFSPPHILIYSGIVGMLLLGMAVMAILAWHAQTQGGFISSLQQQPMLALPLIANLGFLATGPFDDFWHRTFGRDTLTVWSPPHILLVFNLTLSCVSVIGLALWLRSATPRGGLLPCASRHTHRWATGLLILGLSLSMSYFWGFAAGWEVGATDDSTLWMELPWLCLPLSALIIAISITCAAALLPARWWVPAAVIGLSTWLWWMLPNLFLSQVGYRSRDVLPLILPLGCLVYSYIRTTPWPRAARWVVGALSIAAVLLLARAIGRMNYVEPLDILIALPLSPLLIALGERVGTAMANLLLRYAGDQPSSVSAKVAS
jgi:hypothetical protein